MRRSRDEPDRRAPAARPARSTVVQAKLRPAANPAYLLHRPRLHALLDASTVAPLTVVVAPAGSGKTSLLRSWATETSTPLAWLSLDEEDCDPAQLWRGVAAALDGIAPGVAAAVADPLQRPGGLLEAVGVLLDDLEARDYDARALVIDDLHLVGEAEGIAASLAVFVQHLPAWLHVVIASRRTPMLPLNRLRARGQLGEVHFPELRFSFDEAAAMLARLTPSLEPDVVVEVAARAGGWAASIQLAAIEARSAQAQGRGYLPSRDGGRTHLEDYVWHEMLEREREDVVDVLLATAVVKRIDVGLAQVLSGREDAAELLALAEERGLFVSRTEPAGFEMHALVREVLLGVLTERSPERLAQLHGWAAGWHEAHGQTVPALEHYLRADRPRDALRLLAAQSSTLYDSGHESTIVRILRSLPDAVVAGDVTAMMEYAMCHLLVDRRRFVSLVGGLQRIDPEDLADPTVRARLEVLESFAATLRGDWATGSAHSRAALHRLGDTWWLDPLGQFAWSQVARDIALAERWDDSGKESRAVGRALGVVPERRLALEGGLALAQALAGRPVDALRVVAGVRHASEHTHMNILRTESLTAAAVAHRELGDTSIALPLLLEVSEGRVEPGPHCQLLALLELMHTRLGEGSLEAAERAFGRAAELVDTEMPGPGARGWLGRAGVTLSLVAGDLDGARGWATQVVDPFWTGAVAARIHLAAGEPGLAGDAVKGAEPRCPRHEVIAALLRFRSSDTAEHAEQHLLEAVEVAAAHGLVQTVADEGPAVIEGIEHLAWRAPVAWLDRLRRIGPTSAPASAPLGTVGELTERELEVLRILPSRLTLREIADELFISINTLKFHLKVIYRKLDCSSRAEAAEVARSLTSLRRASQVPSTRRR
ncbi:LuxR C-terminal-related transcriptional regulator [Cellulomonas edaphi]|uniref:LuxR C-terminal-related transcriptional regulator n=1 Tax=Cellulomonas edaphi TaxID=3053468 RepID=A0ABT7S597_9CELL|nr:LuxR C-terminal-related transcriptional regulator [Cellulomons edaphi]MDM7830788.1 LuxR C-terminal-related transcriptional regulator [Cellulomons edaphi]